MKNKDIVFSIKGTISKQDKIALRSNNILVIEVDSFQNIKTFNSVANLNPDEMLSLALDSLGYGNDATCRYTFGEKVRKHLLSKDKTP